MIGLVIGYIVFFAVLFASFTVNFIHYMHMFQLNSYSAKEQFHWIRINIGNVLLRHLFSFLAVAYAFIIFIGSESFELRLSDLLACSGLMLMGLAFTKKKKAKKKLVFTPRVIRMCVTTAIVYGAVCALSMIFLHNSLYKLPLLCLWQIFSLLMPMIANLINRPIEIGINNHYINYAKRIIN